MDEYNTSITTPITLNRISDIIKDYTELKHLGWDFLREKSLDKGIDIRFNFDNGVIETECNTSGDCHPEYDWKAMTTLEEFNKWLDKKNKTT